MCDHRSEDTCHADSTWPPRWPNDPLLLKSQLVRPLTLSQGWPVRPKDTVEVMACGFQGRVLKGITVCLGLLGSFVLREASCRAVRTLKQTLEEPV